MAEEQLSKEGTLPKAESARPATLSEMEDLLMDCYDAAITGGETKHWTIFQIVEAYVIDHTHYKE